MMTFLAWASLAWGVHWMIWILRQALADTDPNVRDKTISLLIAWTAASPMVLFPLLWLLNR